MQEPEATPAGATIRVTVDAPRPGEMILVEVAGVPVAVANVGGRLRAFDDTCTHRGCSLSEGTLAGPTVTCECHGSRFDLRFGEPLNGPATSPIRIRSVAQDGGDLLVEA